MSFFERLYEVLQGYVAHSPTLSSAFYVVPFVANAIAYIRRVAIRVQADKKAIEQDLKYHEWLRVGHIVGYILATAIPVVNILWFVFDTMSDLWSAAWKHFRAFFKVRLVR